MITDPNNITNDDVIGFYLKNNLSRNFPVTKFPDENFFNIFKERSSTILLAHWICFGLGSAAVFINLYLMISITVNRKTLIKNIFYALVLHCAFVDLIRSAALIAWCLPGLRLVTFVAFATVKQLLLIVLRSLNLLTALNLLVFTVNEYVLVSKPLHYKRVIRRRLIAILIGLSWILSLTFVLGSVFAQRLTPGIQQVYILSKKGRCNDSMENFTSRMEEAEDEDLESEESNVDGADFLTNSHLNKTFLSNDSEILLWNETDSYVPSPKDFFLARNQFNNDPAHYTSIFAVTIVCFVCLFIVVTCYSVILYRIRKFHISDRSRRTYQQNLNRNQSRKRPTVVEKRCSQILMVQQQDSPTNLHTKCLLVQSSLSPPNLLESRRFSGSSPRLSRVNIYRQNENYLDPQHIKLPPIFRGSRIEETFNETTATKDSTTFFCCCLKNGRFSKILRLKYVAVVGFVLIVDILFLLSYSVIQIFQYLHISRNSYDPNDMLFLRYVLQILIGVHSVLQPLCYFRVRNFCRPLLFSRCREKKGRKTSKNYSPHHNLFISNNNSNNISNYRKLSTRKVGDLQQMSERKMKKNGGEISRNTTDF